MDARNWEILRPSNDKRVDRLLLLSIIVVLDGIVDFRTLAASNFFFFVSLVIFLQKLFSN